MAWLGDGNNVAYSLVEAAGLLGFNIRLGVPDGFDCDAAVIDEARGRGARISVFRDAAAAVDGAQVVVTDTWVSMGQSDGAARIDAMAPFQVNSQLMALAMPDAMFLHCLPAHRGEEVTDAVIDGPQSVVWDEAENRIHAQKSVLRWVFGQI
jgi:ornithine carbamoyltransferase